MNTGTYQSCISPWSWCCGPTRPHTRSGRRDWSGILHSLSHSASSLADSQSPPRSVALQWWSSLSSPRKNTPLDQNQNIYDKQSTEKTVSSQTRSTCNKILSIYIYIYATNPLQNKFYQTSSHNICFSFRDKEEIFKGKGNLCILP